MAHQSLPCPFCGRQLKFDSKLAQVGCQRCKNVSQYDARAKKLVPRHVSSNRPISKPTAFNKNLTLLIAILLVAAVGTAYFFMQLASEPEANTSNSGDSGAAIEEINRHLKSLAD